MKNLAKLNGAKALSKKEQKSINGGCNFKGCDKCRTSSNGTQCNTLNGFGCCINGICILFNGFCR